MPRLDPSGTMLFQLPLELTLMIFEELARSEKINFLMKARATSKRFSTEIVAAICSTEIILTRFCPYLNKPPQLCDTLLDGHIKKLFHPRHRDHRYTKAIFNTVAGVIELHPKLAGQQREITARLFRTSIRCKDQFLLQFAPDTLLEDLPEKYQLAASWNLQSSVAWACACLGLTDDLRGISQKALEALVLAVWKKSEEDKGPIPDQSYHKALWDRICQESNPVTPLPATPLPSTMVRSHPGAIDASFFGGLLAAAVYNGHISTAKYLMTEQCFGADLEQGANPFKIAAQKGDLPALRMLVDNWPSDTIDCSSKCIGGLQHGIRHGDEKLINYYLAHVKMHLNEVQGRMTTEDGQSRPAKRMLKDIMSAIISNRRVDLVRQIPLPEVDHQTLNVILGLAVHFESSDIFDVLCSTPGASKLMVSCPDKISIILQGLLHKAAFRGNLDVVRSLLDASAKVDIPSSQDPDAYQSMGPIMEAVVMDNYEVLRLLVEHRPRPLWDSPYALRIAYLEARKRGDVRAQALLAENGAPVPHPHRSSCRLMAY
ncbi:hypothetical protein BT63DRAFT_425678 [Microthyrium microscopicum]|uniref:Uncharacterized protein n=1 Tax=Microthyrium microscopicum TaxID=703497 RepID=A0A6A6U9S3_9PEZI|nr:hypothetical protein BT63DRAFT_425678 [Microthyrium microscopicum]